MKSKYSLTKEQINYHNYIEVRCQDNTLQDFDLLAILLVKDNKLIDKGDLVFYNSYIRSEEYNPIKWRNKSQWRNHTLPMSVDGSVYTIGEPIDNEAYDYLGEGMFVDLFKTRPEIKKILFFIAVYDVDGNQTLKGMIDVKVRLKAHSTGEILYDSNIVVSFE